MHTPSLNYVGKRATKPEKVERRIAIPKERSRPSKERSSGRKKKKRTRSYKGSSAPFRPSSSESRDHEEDEEFIDLSSCCGARCIKITSFLLLVRHLLEFFA